MLTPLKASQTPQDCDTFALPPAVGGLPPGHDVWLQGDDRLRVSTSRRTLAAAFTQESFFKRALQRCPADCITVPEADLKILRLVAHPTRPVPPELAERLAHLAEVTCCDELAERASAALTTCAGLTFALAQPSLCDAAAAWLCDNFEQVPKPLTPVLLKALCQALHGRRADFNGCGGALAYLYRHDLGALRCLLKTLNPAKLREFVLRQVLGDADAAGLREVLQAGQPSDGLSWQQRAGSLLPELIRHGLELTLFASLVADGMRCVPSTAQPLVLNALREGRDARWVELLLAAGASASAGKSDIYYAYSFMRMRGPHVTPMHAVVDASAFDSMRVLLRHDPGLAENMGKRVGDGKFTAPLAHALEKRALRAVCLMAWALGRAGLPLSSRTCDRAAQEASGNANFAHAYAALRAYYINRSSAPQEASHRLTQAMEDLHRSAFGAPLTPP